MFMVLASTVNPKFTLEKTMNHVPCIKKNLVIDHFLLC